jgi:hypothetical protein
MIAGRWTETQARAALDALEASGASVAAFAARTGVSAWRLYHWRARLIGPAATSFVEIKTAAPQGLGAGAFEVVLPRGFVVRVPADFDAVALQRLVAVLEADPC